MNEVSNFTKKCFTCKEIKSISDFRYKNTAADGCSSSCKTCENKRAVEWRKENPEWLKDYNRKYKYGITKEQWDALFAKQGNKCGICGETTPGSKRDWCTDHDHKTGRVRGILCHRCNLILGKAEDNAVLLLTASKYLAE
jgi:hypothetical protein